MSDDASVFEGWGGTCAGASGATCELTPTDETTITVEATFGLMTTDPPPPTPPPPSPEPPPQPSVMPFEEIDQVIRGLPWVNIAFNAPATLALGESVVVQLLLSPAQPVRRLKRQLTELGERRGARIKASNRMEARLTGVGFRIEAVTPEVQAVAGRQNTEWRWEVEPTGTGTRRLHLTLSALNRRRGDRVASNGAHFLADARGSRDAAPASVGLRRGQLAVALDGAAHPGRRLDAAQAQAAGLNRARTGNALSPTVVA